MPRKYLPTKPSRLRCLFLVLFMIIIYLLDNLPVASFMNYNTFRNIIRPLLWLGLALWVFISPAVRPLSKLRLRESIAWWALVFAVIHIVAMGMAGLFDGFGKSPYSHTLFGMLLNMFLIVTMLLGREAVRGCLVNSLTRKENYLVFILTALFMTSVNYPISKFTALKSLQETVKFIAQFVAPDFSQNLLATYLAFLGGWLPAFIYMVILQAFHWLSPILPNLKWITMALVGVMCPVFSLTAMQNIYLKESNQYRKFYKDDGESPISWMLTAIISIGIVWFAVGVFPVYPSVIATGSMEPMIMPGDIILVDKVTGEEEIGRLKVGDVIQFRSENILISHRIIEIVEKDKEKSYRTKGDNNSVPDTELVKESNVKGRIVKVVPKIGWPTLLIKQKEAAPLEKVVF